VPRASAGSHPLFTLRFVIQTLELQSLPASALAFLKSHVFWHLWHFKMFKPNASVVQFVYVPPLLEACAAFPLAFLPQ
jgi:hypothetical protein